MGDGAGRAGLVTGPVPSGLAAEVALFVRGAGYALERLAEVTDADLGRPTPCGDWDLRRLLLHLADTADGLTGLARTGDLALPSPPRTDDADPAALLEQARTATTQRLAQTQQALFAGADVAEAEAAFA